MASPSFLFLILRSLDHESDLEASFLFFRSLKALWRAQKFNRAPCVPRARGVAPGVAASRARHLASAPPLGRAPSRADLLLSAPASQVRLLSSAPPLQCADSHSARRKRPVHLTDHSARLHLQAGASHAVLEGKAISWRTHSQAIRWHPHALARLSCDPRCHTIMCDRTPLRVHAQHVCT